MLVITLCNAVSINVGNKDELSSDILNQYKNSSGSENEKLKTKIIQNIFNTIGKSEQMPLIETTQLTIVYGDVVGDKQDDAIFTIRMGSKNTIVVVYEKTDDKYKYLSIVGNFFEIKAIQIMAIGKDDKKLIILREYADQMLGAFETATFLRAYRWDNNSFQLVLNVLENYKTYWNELWDNNKPKDESYWLLVKQESESTWKSIKNPSVYVKHNQSYQKSNEANIVNIPDDKNFNVIKNRQLFQLYYWSDKWKHFIINEGTDLKTGEKVAILEDMSQEAFTLVNDNKRYRIKHSDGTIEFTEKNSININSQIQ